MFLKQKWEWNKGTLWGSMKMNQLGMDLSKTSTSKVTEV